MGQIVKKCSRNSLLILLAVPFLVSCSYTFYPSDCAHRLPGPMSKVSELPGDLVETSGVETMGIGSDGSMTDSAGTGRIATGAKGSDGTGTDALRYASFNDSGGEPAIYTFSDDVSMIHKTMISNAHNADWEDITRDDRYFYVADVGNNYGTRDTLTIYRIPEEALRTGDDEVEHDGLITFRYADPVSRDPAGRYSHDCEAVFSYGDSLFLFTKNWVDLSTSVYRLPKQPGHYEISPIVTYPVGALITGGDVDPGKKEVVLIGYRNLMPVLILYSFDVSPSHIECGGKARRYPFRYGRQTEAVCFGPSGRMVITAEKRIRPQAMFVSY